MKTTLLSILFFSSLISGIIHSQESQLLPIDRFIDVTFSGEDYDSPDMLQNFSYAVGTYVVEDQHLVFATFDGCTEISHEALAKEFIPFLPFDGGVYFLEILFDPELRTFYQVYIRGEA